MYYMYIYGAQEILTNLTKDANRDDLSHMFSGYVYYYKHNFLSDIQKHISNIQNNFYIPFFILFMVIGSIAREIIFKEDTGGNFINIIQSILPLIFVIFYAYILTSKSLMQNTTKFSPQEIKDEFSNNVDIYMNYSTEYNNLTQQISTNNDNELTILTLIMVLISTLLGVWDYWHRGPKDIERYSKTCVSFCGIIFILFIAIYLKMSNELIGSILYLLKNYDTFVDITLTHEQLKQMKTIDRVDNVTVGINNIMFINIPSNFITNNALKSFKQQFDELLQSGKIIEAKQYIAKCPSDELKEFLTQEINNTNRTILRNAYLQYSHGKVSFVINDNSIFKEYTISSKNGIIFELTAPSGKGKSTIINTILGLTKFLGTTANGHPTRFINSFKSEEVTTARGKQLIPSHADIFQPFVNILTLFQNFQIADPNITKEEVKELLKECDMSQFEESLDNLFSMIRFSKGEGDRIKVIRTFVALKRIIKESNGKDLNSFMIMMDEAFGALDTTNSTRIIALLQKYLKNHNLTSIIVDHSGAIREHSDVVAKIQNQELKFFVKNDNGDHIEINEIPFNSSNTAIVNGKTITVREITKEELINKYVYEKLKENTHKELNKIYK